MRCERWPGAPPPAGATHDAVYDEFERPTVLAGITPEMRVHRDVVFGPVATFYRVPDLDTGDRARQRHRVRPRRQRVDQRPGRTQPVHPRPGGRAVFINGNVASYPQLPFGGVKSSGHGRELSYQGIREFCNIRPVWVG
jgi:succinate-semialdehyde dehydrogenase / glutarate-semialdehyde dehydrogenase